MFTTNIATESVTSQHSQNLFGIESPTITPVSQKKIQNTQKSPNMYSYNQNQYTNVYSSTEVSLNNLEKILEKERIYNKTESWNKLDKTVKLHKLHSFSEKYGKEHHLSIHNVKTLKSFFRECLESNKLNKTKDLVYDKETNEIINIPSLHFNSNGHNFTLKIVDTKRVSTLKCLTLPKRVIVIDDTITKNEVLTTSSGVVEDSLRDAPKESITSSSLLLN